MWKALAGDEYFSDALSLTDMDDKSGAEKTAGLLDHRDRRAGYGMKKADIEKVKSFLQPRTTSTAPATARWSKVTRGSVSCRYG